MYLRFLRLEHVGLFSLEDSRSLTDGEPLAIHGWYDSYKTTDCKFSIMKAEWFKESRESKRYKGSDFKEKLRIFLENTDKKQSVNLGGYHH